MSRVVRVKYENGVLKPLEPLDIEEGEEVQIILKAGRGSLTQRFYGIAKKRRPGLTKGEFLRILEEIENEDIRGL